MSKIESKLEALGLVLPELIKAPAGMKLPFSWVRLRGNRAYISGHIAQNSVGLPPAKPAQTTMAPLLGLKWK